MRIVLLRSKHILYKIHAQSERFYILFAYLICFLREASSLVLVVIKYQNKYFIQVKTHLLVVDLKKKMLVLASH